jgi:hypothetical protein
MSASILCACNEDAGESERNYDCNRSRKSAPPHPHLFFLLGEYVSLTLLVHAEVGTAASTPFFLGGGAYVSLTLLVHAALRYAALSY